MVDALTASMKDALPVGMQARVAQYAERRCRPQLEFLNDYVSPALLPLVQKLSVCAGCSRCGTFRWR